MSRFRHTSPPYFVPRSAGLLVVTFYFLVGWKQATVAEELHPLNYLKVADVAVVEGHPNTGRGKIGEELLQEWLPQNWHILLRVKQNPEVFDRVQQAFQKNGLVPRAANLRDSDLGCVEEFLRRFNNKGGSVFWKRYGASEFEGLDRYTKFLQRHGAKLEFDNLKLPIRIGRITRVSLGDYDRANGGFKIRMNSLFHTDSISPFHYETSDVTTPVEIMPMPEPAARNILGRLRNRKIDVLVSYHLDRLDPNPQNPNTGVIGRLSSPRFDFYLPDQYATRISTVAPQPVISGPSVSDRAVGPPNDAVAAKMRKLSAEMGLLNIDGIPVSGSLARLGLDGRVVDVAKNRQRNLSDRMVIAEFPELTIADTKLKNNEIAVAGFTRLLGSNVMAQYLDPRLRNWAGDDPFAQRSSKNQFLQDHAKTIRSLHLKPPMRFCEVKIVELGDYDFKAKGYPIKREADNGVSEIDFSIDDLTPRWWFHQKSLPASYGTPKIILTSEQDGRAIETAIKKLNSSERIAFEIVTFDLVGTVPASQETSHVDILPSSYEVRIVSSYLCESAIGQGVRIQVPIEQPQLSILNGEPDSTKHISKRSFLWEPDVQTMLLEDAGFQPATGDWLSAAAFLARQDTEYYLFGRRLGFDGPPESRGQIQRLAANAMVEREGVFRWEQSTNPMFPQDWLASSPSKIQTMINDEVIASIRYYSKKKVAAANEEYLLDVNIRLDRDKGLARIDYGSSMKDMGQFALSLINDSPYGMVRRLRPPDSLGGFFRPEDHRVTEFSVAFPAYHEALHFEVDPSRFPPSQLKRNDLEVYSGNLVVKLNDIEQPAPGKFFDRALFHVQPVRFDHVVKTTLAPDSVVPSYQVQFSVPAIVAPLTKRDAEAQREAERLASVKAMKDKERQRKEKRASEYAAELARRKQADEEAKQKVKAEQREQEAKWARQAAAAKQQSEQVTSDRETAQTADDGLMEESYTSDDIDWATGKIRSNAVPDTPKTDSRLGTVIVWMIVPIACVAIYVVRSRLKTASGSSKQ